MIVAACFFTAANVNAQNGLKVEAPVSALVQNAEVDQNGSIIHVQPTSSWAKTSDENLAEVLSSAYGLKETATLSVVTKSNDGISDFSKLIQTVSNIPVEGSEVIVHRNAKGEITGVFGTLRQVPQNETAQLSDFEAMNRAVKFIGENQAYSWKTEDALKPMAQLVYAPVNGNFEGEYRLAYKQVLSVTGENPARWIVYIDAKNGEVINYFNSIHTTAAVGSGSSLYSGTVSITTDLVSGTYSMKDVSKKIETYNMNNKTTYNTAALFTDTDNVWNTTAQRAGVDAHYGATKTYDYYLNIHGRNSYDGLGATIKSYVHYSNNYNNAYWDGTRMTYGDGDGTTFTPLVTIDVAGHEITHAVTEKTANLTYQNESGALNEAWSDMFGTAIEFYAYGTGGNWLIGEGCYTPSTSGVHSGCQVAIPSRR